MKAIVITLIACATAITCVVLVSLRVEHPPRQPLDQLQPPRYHLYGIAETVQPNGQRVSSVYRLDTISGRTWRMSSTPLQTKTFDEQHKPVMMWADGWDEMPESRDAAVAKMRAEHPEVFK